MFKNVTLHPDRRVGNFHTYQHRKSQDYSGLLERVYYQFHLYNFRLFKALCLKTPPYAQY
ncbi:hypothetical protein SAMN04488522_10316 [Pedobacter caeni]|uniref:Uncharacterized protein n=1 Tax=Pedobacter caeni TaxID=288992 RepID=A0A1M5D015_9SPHI|nr:hypothetical protein SAMN04488522_10316 [Pedobacter caeni]